MNIPNRASRNHSREVARSAVTESGDWAPGALTAVVLSTTTERTIRSPIIAPGAWPAPGATSSSRRLPVEQEDRRHRRQSSGDLQAEDGHCLSRRQRHPVDSEEHDDGYLARHENQPDGGSRV